MIEEQSNHKSDKIPPKYEVLACIEDGEVKCACAKETCKTCEFRETFECQDAKLIIL